MEYLSYPPSLRLDSHHSATAPAFATECSLCSERQVSPRSRRQPPLHVSLLIFIVHDRRLAPRRFSPRPHSRALLRDQPPATNTSLHDIESSWGKSLPPPGHQDSEANAPPSSVPKFFRWISERYPGISQLIAENRIPEFDCLYVCAAQSFQATSYSHPIRPLTSVLSLLA